MVISVAGTKFHRCKFCLSLWVGLVPYESRGFVYTHTWKMECISEGDMVLVQREKTYRTFVLKRGR